ncbi:CLN3 protein-domain-containing protein [Pyronema omphalodes]|nr:CLN3 protein-domain-containing protein [Pyronema omphalodes]
MSAPPNKLPPRPKRRATANSRTTLHTPSLLTHYDTFNHRRPERLPKRASSAPPSPTQSKMRKSPGWISTETLVFFSFWLFGTVVTMQFGVVVTAANDLVGNSAPPGLILFAYTLPSILVRMFVPYIRFPEISLAKIKSWFSPSTYSPLSKGDSDQSAEPERKSGAQEVNYAARLTLLAWGNNVPIQVVGIAFASLSSNLGDMSFYQLATRYHAMITQSFSGYAAGSGAAGLIGSFLYTLSTTSFGVRPSAVLSFVGTVPCLMLLTYFLLLPSAEEINRKAGIIDDDEEEESIIGPLKLREKLQLVRPMIWGYMAPLAILMFMENVTTQGILPTILWHLPFRNPLLDSLFKTTRDFYPTFFTIYQLAIFFGRTSITLFRLPGGNKRSSKAYYTLCILELGFFFAMLFQSISMAGPAFSAVDPDAGVLFSPFSIAAIIFSMGLCGGLGMSNTYWRVSKKPLPPTVWKVLERVAPRKTITARAEGVFTPMINQDGPVEEEEEEEDYFFQKARPHPRPRMRSGFSSMANLRSLSKNNVRAVSEDRARRERRSTGEMDRRDSVPMLSQNAASQGRRGSAQWTQNEETAVREFLISTIALPDTLAIFIASIVTRE